MPFQIRDWSSDIVVEATGSDASEALSSLAQGVAHVLTQGGKASPAQRVDQEVHGRDEQALVVAFVNDLVYRFVEDGFLPAGGSWTLEAAGSGLRLTGPLAGEVYDAGRHGRGVEVKAATFHDLAVNLRAAQGPCRIRVLLDL